MNQFVPRLVVMTKDTWPRYPGPRETFEERMALWDKLASQPLPSRHSTEE